MGTISKETAEKLASAWGVSNSLADACKTAGIVTTDQRAMRRYRRQAEELLGVQLKTQRPQNSSSNLPHSTDLIHYDHAYTSVIFSDGHFWPGQTSRTFWILLEILMDLEPEVVIDNGDSWDGAAVSRHAPTTWEHLPTLREELDNLHDHMEMIEEAAGDADLYRNIGNHDLRFEAKLAQQAPEMKGMPYTTISELFAGWRHNYSVCLSDELIVKHRWHSGMHAAYNNVLKAGKSIATGHTHRLQVRPYSDYSGTRYGIETGTIADPYGPQFSYGEDNPRDWHPGFVVVTLEDGKLFPEEVRVQDGQARFRGKTYRG